MNMVRQITGREKKEGGFKKAFRHMPHDEITKVRDEICALCFWTIGNFRAKVVGMHYFRLDEIEKLEKYFAEKGIDAWTGEPILK